MYLDKCYLCNQPLEHIYRIKIIDTDTGELKFVNCCSEECAEMLKENNANIHKQRYEDVAHQCIQKHN